METKFTKGEWVILEADFSTDGSVITSEKRDGMVDICSLDSCYLDDEEKNSFEVEQLANAHLIAAAPEMYEMLEDILKNYECGSIECGNVVDDQIERILAKARGE